jgi:hypothetical protein
LLGQACLVLWSVWAWGQRSNSAAAAAAANTKQGTATVPAGDPFISLLLAALPLTAEQLSVAAVLLPPALYEGLCGAAAVMLMSGRWAAWLLLWEVWLCCCYANCRLGCSSRCLQEAAQPGQEVLVAANGRHVIHSPSQQQQRLEAPQKLVGCNTSSASSTQRLLALLSQPILLAAAQLLLPVCMAVVAVWR